METLKGIAARLKNFSKNLNKRQRWTLIGLTSLLLLFFGGLLVFAGKENYAPLFSDLQINDQAAIVEVLKEKGVNYRLAPESSTILVPEDSVYSLRLAMATSGLPRNGTVGYEIFDNAKMGMTDFEQQVAYMRALEGELARTIGKLDVVKSARVNVVMPKQKLFLKEQQPATASVLLRLNPGRNLEPDQIKAVMRLVASSVEGLSSDNISIVDTSGRLLSDLAGDGYLMYPRASGGVTSVQRELEKHQEKELERKVMNMLSAIFGRGNSVVRVRMELDFTKLSRKRQDYVPLPKGKGVVRSVQTNEESYSGSAAQNQGVGTSSNIPGYAVKSSGSNTGDYSKTDQVINYEISEIHQEEEKAPGTVKRITASVIINADQDPADSEELMASLSAAMGIDRTRGDILSLSFMPFASPDRYTMAASSESTPGPVKKYLIPFLLVAALGAAGFLLLKRMRRPSVTEESTAQVQDEKGQNGEKLWDIPKDEMQILEEQVGLYAESNPEEVAAIVKKWLEES